VLGHRLEEIRRKHEGNEKLLAYLDTVREKRPGQHRRLQERGRGSSLPVAVPENRPAGTGFLPVFRHVIVTTGDERGSVRLREQPDLLPNLFGRIEHRFQMGAALTDFTMIKSGALHKANGGFLVINALDLLRNIFSYDAAEEGDPQPGGEDRGRLGAVPSRVDDGDETGTDPPGRENRPDRNPEIYYLLYNLDEEYRELFKVKADFDHRIERTEEERRHYAAFVATKVKEEALMPFAREGVARVVDFGSRLAEDQGKLSTKFSDVSNLLREANYWASREGAKVVTGDHVSRALRAKDHAETAGSRTRCGISPPKGPSSSRQVGNRWVR